MKYIAMSLFGDDPKYRNGLVECISSANKHYVDWVSVIYCDRANFEFLSLRNLQSTRLILHKDVSSGVEGASWRYLATTLIDSEVVIFRDVDSIFTARERIAVDEWLASKFEVHLIRDHPYHASLVMGGMFGVRGGSMRLLAQLMEGKMNGVRLTEYGDDQVFLSSVFYPKVKFKALVHTNSIKYFLEYALPLLPEADGEDFIGAYAYVTDLERAEYRRIKDEAVPVTLGPPDWKQKRILKLIYRRFPIYSIKYRWRYF